MRLGKYTPAWTIVTLALLAGVMLLGGFQSPLMARSGLASTTGCQDQISNGSFETGDFSGWSTTGSPWMASYLAHDGSFSGVVGGADYADDSFYQEVTLPANASSATLTYWWYVYTQESNVGTAWDFLTVEVQDASGAVLVTLETLSNTSPTDVWQQSTLDLLDYPSLLGQTVRIVFHGLTDYSNFTSFYIDEVQLTVCAEEPTCSDEYEPNDSFAAALEITPGQEIMSAICNSDDLDYFRFTAAAGDQITVQLYSMDTNADLELYGPAQAQIGQSNNSGTTPEQIVVTADQAGTYYVLVYGTEGENVNQYRLRVDIEGEPTVTPTPTITPTPTATPPYPTCPDSFEPNDTLGGPTWSILNSPLVSYICAASDVDYWKIESVSVSQTLKIQLYDLPHDYDLTLYRPAPGLGQAVYSDNAGQTAEVIAFTADTAGDWYAGVTGQGSHDASTPYTVLAEAFDCELDRLEGNDDAGQATDLGSVHGAGQSEGGLSICPSGDEDWFTMQLDRDDRLTAEVSTASSWDLLRLCLIGPDRQTELACTPGVSNSERIDYTLTQAGRFYLRVQAAAPQHPTNTWYNLNVSARAPTPTPTSTPTITPTPTATPTPTRRYPGCPDIHEPNDTPAQASPLNGTAQSYLCARADKDYWRFDVNLGSARQKIIQLELDHPTQAFWLILYRPDGTTAVTPGVRTGRGNEVIASFAADQSGTWYAEVSVFGLAVADPTRPYTLSALVFDCSDVYEPNDDFSLASPMGLISPLTVQSYLCRSWDKDYFWFRATAGQRIGISLLGYAPDYTFTLYNPWKLKVASSSASLIHDAQISGDYFVKVQSRSGWRYSPTYPYELTVTLGPRPTLPDADLRLMDMEVIQSIQDLDNNVFLVTGKPTYVRLYAGIVGRGVATARGYVTGSLSSTALSPAQVPCLNTVHPYTTQTTTRLREELSLSINCLLPASWLQSAGTLQITGTVYATDINEQSVSNNTRSASLTVWPSPPLRLQMVQVRDGCDPGHCSESNGPAWADYADLHSLIQRMYPVSRVAFIPPRGASVRWNDEDPTLTALRGLASTLGGQPNTHIMGAVRDSVFSFGLINWGRGLGEMGDATWGNGIASWVEVGAGERSQTLAAHELGHNLRLNHADSCWAGEPFDTFRGVPNIDDGNVRHIYGLDTGSNPPKVVRPSTKELMTYCRPVWLSQPHYTTLHEALRAGAGWPKNLAAPDEQFLVLVGRIDPQSDEVHLQPVIRADGASLNPSLNTNPDGDYALQLLDAGDNLLFERSFGLTEGNHQDSGAPLLLVAPDDPALARLAIVHSGLEIYSQAASAHPPTVALQPVSAEVPDPLTVSWAMDDQDGDELTAQLWFSADDGAVWEPLAAGLQSSQTELTTTFWPQTTQGRLRIQVSDGLHAAEDMVGPFSAPAKKPVLLITAPANWTVIAPDEPLLLAATAYDAEDGPLTGDAINWTSDREGDLGVGEQLLLADLSPGWHRITATTADSDDNAVSDTIALFIGQRLYLPTLVKQ